MIFGKRVILNVTVSVLAQELIEGGSTLHLLCSAWA